MVLPIHGVMFFCEQCTRPIVRRLIIEDVVAEPAIPAGSTTPNHWYIRGPSILRFEHVHHECWTGLLPETTVDRPAATE